MWQDVLLRWASVVATVRGRRGCRDIQWDKVADWTEGVRKRPREEDDSPVVTPTETAREKEVSEMLNRIEQTRRELRDARALISKLEKTLEKQEKEAKGMGGYFFNSDEEEWQKVAPKTKKNKKGKFQGNDKSSVGGKSGVDSGSTGPNAVKKTTKKVAPKIKRLRKLEDGSGVIEYHVEPAVAEVDEAVEEITAQPARQLSRNPEIKVVGRFQYDGVATMLKELEIEAKYKFVKDGLLIFTRGPEDYRKVQATMRQSGITGHWHNTNQRSRLGP